MDRSELSIVGASFGHPLCEKTFSGVPKYLFAEFDRLGLMKGYINTKQVRPQDILTGAIDFSKIKTYGRPGMKAGWLWRVSNAKKLSQRVSKIAYQQDHFNVFFQIGTQIWYYGEASHYCFTDMTIQQAAEAGQFSIRHLIASEINQAVQVQRRVFESCKRVFVPSNWTKKGIIEHYGISEDNIVVVGLGASVSPKAIENKSYDSNTILFVGRDWDRKGGKVLLEAFHRVRKKLQSSKLIIIGCTPSIYDEGVQVLGYLDKDKPEDLLKIHKAFAESSVMCVPSLFEPFGICFLESQYYGVVPVTFRGQGRDDAIVHEQTGVLLDNFDAVALERTIINLLGDKEKLKKMASEGRAYVAANYTWAAVAPKIINVIKQDIYLR